MTDNVLICCIINVGGAMSEASVVWLLWSLGAGIYVQFHGIHTAAAMFKVGIIASNNLSFSLILIVVHSILFKNLILLTLN